MHRQYKRHRKVSAYFVSVTAILITLLAGIPSCSSQETHNEQFDNNSTGMDRDHTEVHQEDTLKVDTNEIRDNIRK
jgi:hypothetical protein